MLLVLVSLRFPDNSKKQLQRSVTLKRMRESLEQSLCSAEKQAEASVGEVGIGKRQGHVFKPGYKEAGDIHQE